MGIMQKVTATEFQNAPGKYQDKARSEPVTITKQGRDDLVVLSAVEYERLKKRDREAVLIENLPPDVLQGMLNALANTEAPPELDDLLKE
jgi:prevent-host-death family protein